MKLTLRTFLSAFVGRYDELNIINEDTDQPLTEDEILAELTSNGVYGGYVVSEFDVSPIPGTVASYWIVISIKEETK